VIWRPGDRGRRYLVQLAVGAVCWFAAYAVLSETGWVDPDSTRMWPSCTLIALAILEIADTLLRRRRRTVAASSE